MSAFGSAFPLPDLLAHCERRLQALGLPNALGEARELVSHVFKRRPMDLSLDRHLPVSEDQRERVLGLLAERCARKPLAHVLGQWDFHGRTFQVTPDVLIPRPETEELVERALQVLGKNPQAQLLADVGTGSGCIAVTLAKGLPRSRVVATDVSAPALNVARHNAQEHRVADRLSLMRSDLLGAWEEQGLRRVFDGMVANLPYVKSGEVNDLTPEVRQEPGLALTAGDDGLDIIKRFIPQAQKLLRPGGHLFLEMGHDHAEPVRATMSANGFGDIDVFKDFAEVPRFIQGRVNA